MKTSTAALLLIAAASIFATVVVARTYQVGEDSYVYVNRVGPYDNPQETYGYFSLGLCPPEVHKSYKREGLGATILGYDLDRSNIKLMFRVDAAWQVECTQVFTQNTAKALRHAIREQYWYQFFYDDLPVWGMVGEVVHGDDGKHFYYVYTHKDFVVFYNVDRVIEVNLNYSNPKLVDALTPLSFTYSVSWVPTNVDYEDRFKKYLDYNFFEHQIHWFSIFNSFMMVVFLVGLVAMIMMRTLHRDIAAGSARDEEGDDFADESGWKKVRGDVFRAPTHTQALCVLVGTGTQLSWMVFFVIITAALGTFYVRRGTVMTAIVLIYAVTSFIGGYISGSMYAQFRGKHWIRTALFTAVAFPGACVAIEFCMNFIATMYGSLSAVPITTQFLLLCIWLFVSLPLCLFGTIFGRNVAAAATAASGAKQQEQKSPKTLPRPVTPRKWYIGGWMHMLAGGLLPFGSIFIEMYFIFTSMWHYKYYYVYGFLLMVYLILVIVTVCVTIVSTYMLLNNEDYRWQWSSMVSAGSTALYVFLYSIYYFVAKTEMYGLLQTIYYFGSMSVLCLGISLLCGAVGYYGANTFVKRIYAYHME